MALADVAGHVDDIDRRVALSDRGVFCAAVDVNGSLPSHDRTFSMPQRRGDPTWNAAHCRNRSLFNDRVGFTAGQNTQAFCLHACRRDMGGGGLRR